MVAQEFPTSQPTLYTGLPMKLLDYGLKPIDFRNPLAAEEPTLPDGLSRRTFIAAAFKFVLICAA